MQLKDKLLSSFGLITCCFEGDILKCHMQLVAYLIGMKNYQVIDLNILKRDFLECFGYRIPSPAIDEIMDLCFQYGVVERMEGKFYPKIQELHKYDLSKKSLEYDKKHNALINGLVEYSINELKYDAMNYELAEKALTDFAQLYSISAIMSRATELNDDNTNLNYIVGRFLDELRHSNEEMFNDAMGFFVSSTVLSVIKTPEFNNFNQHINNLNIMLDTRFLFKLLEFEGTEVAEAYKEIIAQLQKQGVKLHVFKHTLDEMCIILENAANVLSNFNYGKATIVARYIHRNGWNKQDVQDYIDNIKQELNKFSINIFTDYVQYKDISWQSLDEDGLVEKVKEAYLKNNQNREIEFRIDNQETVIKRDVKSVVSIHNLRRGKFPATLNEAEYIFITTNKTFTRISKKYWRTQFGLYNDVPPCLTDVYISTYLWIQSEAEFKCDFNRKKLIADICSIIEPKAETFAKIDEQVTKLCHEGLSEEKCILLRTKGLSDRHLLDRVTIDSNPITMETAEEVYSRLVKNITEPKDNKIKELSGEVEDKNVTIDSLNNAISEYEAQENEKRNLSILRKENASKKVDHLAGLTIPCICFILSLISVVLGYFRTIKPELAGIIIAISILLSFIKDIIIAKLKWKDSKLRNTLVEFFETAEYHKSKSMNKEA